MIMTFSGVAEADCKHGANLVSLAGPAYGGWVPHSGTSPHGQKGRRHSRERGLRCDDLPSTT